MSVAEIVGAFRHALGRTLIHSVEPTDGPWHNQNTWGDQFSKQFPLAANQIVQVLPKLDRMYGPPAVHSIQLARGDETPSQNADIRARVSYGCGGVNNSFDCDWLHGAQFSLVCNSVTVSGVTYAPIPGGYNAAAGNLFLGVTACKGTVAPVQWPLTYTEPQLTDLTGANHDFQVRDFVRALTIHYFAGFGPTNSDPALPTGVSVIFLSNSFQLGIYDLQVFAGGRAVPIPGGTTAIRIVGAAGSKTYIVQWFLGL